MAKIILAPSSHEVNGIDYRRKEDNDLDLRKKIPSRCSYHRNGKRCRHWAIYCLCSLVNYEHLADASAIEKPKTFLLGQNYPNPFNPTTTMDYQLASPGYVSVVVYNILGEEVARLVQTQQDAGYYSTAWNAASSPSGIYYVRMTVSGQSGKQLYATTKKLMLMK